MNTLYQLTGPNFCCGLVVGPKGFVIRAAPLIRHWERRHVKALVAWVREPAQRGRYFLRAIGPDPYEAVFRVTAARRAGAG